MSLGGKPRNTRARIDEFLSRKKLALAGASRSGKKFGNVILRELRSKGYEVVPVHPDAETIDGVGAVRSVGDLPHDIGGLIVVLPPQTTQTVVAEAVAAGIDRIWIQQGAASDATERFCEEKDVEAVHGECILMFAEPAAWIHRAHRFIRGAFGRLPA